MTKDEALQIALDSMKEIIHWYAVRDRNDVFLNFVDQNLEIQKIMKSISVVKEALETKEGLLDRKSYLLGLYDQKPWVGLTDEDMNNALDYWSDDSRSSYGGAHAANGEYVDMIETWRYIETKLKERNT